MAMIDRNFTFATNGTVTANDLHNLIDSATIYQDLITGQQPITSVGTNYELLIADGTNPNAAPNAVTVYDLFEDALTAGTYTNANISAALTYGTATGTRLVSTNATITTGTITTAVIPTLTAGTTTSTAATITSGTITNLASTTGTIATLNSTTGTIATLNSTTPTFLGAITASTNTINVGSSQIYKDASGNVGVGTASPRGKLDVSGGLFLAAGNQIQITGNSGTDGLQIIGNDASESLIGTMSSQALVLRTASTERLRIASAGQIGIGGANYGTSGQVLTSAGVSAAPSWTTITTTPADGSITLAKLSTSSTEADNVAKRTAKVWVNFIGTPGSVSIRSDFNVSTVAETGSGDYTVNFSSNLADSDYATVVSAAKADANNDVVVKTAIGFTGTTYSTSAVRVQVDSGGARTTPRMCLIVFGN